MNDGIFFRLSFVTHFHPYTRGLSAVYYHLTLIAKRGPSSNLSAVLFWAMMSRTSLALSSAVQTWLIVTPSFNDRSAQSYTQPRKHRGLQVTFEKEMLTSVSQEARFSHVHLVPYLHGDRKLLVVRVALLASREQSGTSETARDLARWHALPAPGVSPAFRALTSDNLVLK